MRPTAAAPAAAARPAPPRYEEPRPQPRPAVEPNRAAAYSGSLATALRGVLGRRAPSGRHVSVLEPWPATPAAITLDAEPRLELPRRSGQLRLPPPRPAAAAADANGAPAVTAVTGPADDPWNDEPEPVSTFWPQAKPMDDEEPWVTPPATWPIEIRPLRSNGRQNGGDAERAEGAGFKARPVFPCPPLPLTGALPPEEIWAEADVRRDRREPTMIVVAGTAHSPRAERPPQGAPSLPHDNLRRIKGIGRGFEKHLNQLGIYRFAQIAEWTEAEQEWIGNELGFVGRVQRDGWVRQAELLLAHPTTLSALEAEIGRDL